MANKKYVSSHTGQQIDDAIDLANNINGKVPPQASTTNQLADKNYVDTNIATKITSAFKFLDGTLILDAKDNTK